MQGSVLRRDVEPVGDPGAVKACGVDKPDMCNDTTEAEAGLLPVVCGRRGLLCAAYDVKGRRADSGAEYGETADEADLARTSRGVPSPERLICGA